MQKRGSVFFSGKIVRKKIKTAVIKARKKSIIKASIKETDSNLDT